MARASLTFAGLAALRGGAFAAEVDRELRSLLHDMMQRPGDGSTRSLTIKVDLKPKSTTDHLDRLIVEEVVISASASSKVPKLAARPVRARIEGDDAPFLSWEEDAPDSPTQKSLLDSVSQEDEDD